MQQRHEPYAPHRCLTAQPDNPAHRKASTRTAGNVIAPSALAGGAAWVISRASLPGGSCLGVPEPLAGRAFLVALITATKTCFSGINIPRGHFSSDQFIPTVSNWTEGWSPISPPQIRGQHFPASQRCSRVGQK